MDQCGKLVETKLWKLTSEQSDSYTWQSIEKRKKVNLSNLAGTEKNTKWKLFLEMRWFRITPAKSQDKHGMSENSQAELLCEFLTSDIIGVFARVTDILW